MWTMLNLRRARQLLILAHWLRRARNPGPASPLTLHYYTNREARSMISLLMLTFSCLELSEKTLHDFPLIIFQPVVSHCYLAVDKLCYSIRQRAVMHHPVVEGVCATACCVFVKIVCTWTGLNRDEHVLCMCFWQSLPVNSIVFEQNNWGPLV